MGLPEWSSLRGFNRHFGKPRLVATRSAPLPVAVVIQRQLWRRTFRAGPSLRLSSTSASRSAVCSDSHSPAGKPPTKAGWVQRGRRSPGELAVGNRPVNGSQSIVDSSDRSAGMSAAKHRLHQLASIGGPRRCEPQWMPADEGRSNDRSRKD